MKLTALRKLTGQIELVSGLHIGSGNTLKETARALC